MLFFTSSPLSSQLYLDKQTRHRFAQMTVGIDYQASVGGNTQYISAQGVRQSLDLSTLHRPRFLIGGTHFWGHADFYIAIPLLNPTFLLEDQKIDFSSGVETVFKYYPLQMEDQKVRPYVGLSLAPFTYKQYNTAVMFGNGPLLVNTSIPLLSGLTFLMNQHVFEAGMLWNYNLKQDYYISRTDQAEINTPPFYLSLSYKWMFETTLSAESDWESGRTNEVTDILAERGKLNGFFIGAGLSSSFWNGPSDYNDDVRPYIMDYPISIMPDVALGYYLHDADMAISASYRSYGTTTDAYGARQELRRKSLGLEVTKFVFDYHGFVPFIGPVVTYEQLNFVEVFEGQLVTEVRDDLFSYGLVFGWDIRPNRLQSWLLRTNLRWFPDLKLKVEGDRSISFDNVEFNFIQLIVFPGRMF